MSDHMIEITDISFEQEVLKETHRLTIVDFWAPWCGPCKMIAPHLEALAASRKDLKVVKMNIDENQIVPTSLAIRSIPTLMLFKDGALLSTKMGAASKSDLNQWINSIMSEH